MIDNNNDNKDKNTENNSDDELNNQKEENSENLDTENNELKDEKDNPEKEEGIDISKIEEKETEIKDEKQELLESETHQKNAIHINEENREIKTDSKYQISLIDEENLKIKVLLDTVITIDCTAKGNQTETGFQSNKIILTPEKENDYKEIEVSISLESENTEAGNKITGKKETNYKVNLLDESRLRIVLTTEKKLTIDCTYKDKELKDSNFNTITINPQRDRKKQEVEILLTLQEKKVNKEDLVFEPGKLIPNPEVADLLATTEVENIPMTPEEKLNDLLYKNNPFVAQRKLLQNNLLRGAVTANILFILAIFGFYAWGSQTETIPDARDQRRLIILQDLPDPKINLENVEDPLKKPEEVTEESGENPNVVIRKVTPRRFNRPPVVNNNLTTRNDDTTRTRDTTDVSNELDSLLKNQGLTSDSTSRADSNLAQNVIPDSLRKEFSENEVGLRIGVLPKSWKAIDNREINQQSSQFEGLVLGDTTLPQGAVNIFIYIDREGKDYNNSVTKEPFTMTDTSITAFKSTARTLAGVTEIKYYLFTKTEKISIGAKFKKDYLEKYLPVAEEIIRSIMIVPPKSSGN